MIAKRLKNRHRQKQKVKELERRFSDSVISSTVIIDNNTRLEGENFVGSHVNIKNTVVGYATVIGNNTSLPSSKIGRFCSIAQNVHVQSSTHALDAVSTYPGFFKTINDYPFGRGKKYKNEFLQTRDGFSCVIGNDVWIGENVIIRGGVSINDGAVIGMGAVVTKDVPAYAIVGGVPAKLIRYRMTNIQIKNMLEIKWWNWEKETIKSRRDEFSDINEFIKKYGKEYQ